MTTYITLPTRSAWSQRMAHDLWSDAVGNRMQRLACFEAHRLGGASVQVNATDGGGVWRVLQWPAEGLAYWLETTSPLRS